MRIIHPTSCDASTLLIAVIVGGDAALRTQLGDGGWIIGKDRLGVIVCLEKR